MKLEIILSFALALSATIAKAQDENLTLSVDHTVAMLNEKTNQKTTISNDYSNFDVEKSRSITKIFPLGKNDKVVLGNIFGSISVKTWDKNEVKVDVEIKVSGNSDEEAIQLLNNISITGLKEGDQASFKTSIAEGKSKRRSRNGNQMKISYTVYMPANNSLTATQQYGNITLPNFSGATFLKVQYGDLILGDLSNTNNYISVQYGKANLGNINAAKIKQQYGSGLVINSVKVLDLSAQYCKVNIGSIIGEARIDQQYGSGLRISKAKDLVLKSQYCDVNIGEASGYVSAKLGYSKLSIDNVTNDCKKMELSASYGNVSLGLAPNFNGDFNLGVDYGSFNYGANVAAQKSDQNSSTSKKYIGKIGNGGNASIDIKVGYGSVKFN